MLMGEGAVPDGHCRRASPRREMAWPCRQVYFTARLAEGPGDELFDSL